MKRSVAILLAALPLYAAPTIDLSLEELISEGSAQFAKSCAVGYCHGSEGRSARGPALRDRVWDPHDLYRITAEGLPGTSMPGWHAILGTEGIWAVTAYVLSLSSEPPTGAAALVEATAEPGGQEPSELSDRAARGKFLFFDLTRMQRCAVCHEMDGLGTAVGPNLAIAAQSKTSEELTRDILEPHATIAYGFEQLQLTLNSGERIEGVLADESEGVVQVFDAASVPPPLRSVRKTDLRSQRTVSRSSMPEDLATVYTGDELAAIVAYLDESAE